MQLGCCLFEHNNTGDEAQDQPSILVVLGPLQPSSEEDFTLVVSLNEYILRGDAVGTSCTYVDSRV
jgi:hypothetical protein